MISKPVAEYLVAQIEATTAEDPTPARSRALLEILQTGEILEHGEHRYVLAQISNRT